MGCGCRETTYEVFIPTAPGSVEGKKLYSTTSKPGAIAMKGRYRQEGKKAEIRYFKGRAGHRQLLKQP